MRYPRWAAVCITAALAAPLMAACTSGQPQGGGEAKTEIALWTPQAGSPKVEVENMQRMIDEFTEKNPQYSFTYKTYPFDSYATSVQGAAAAGQLPCMLAVDAPVAPNWAWAQYLQPLDLPSSVTDQLIPGAKGTYRDKIYSAGYWDAGLSIFARKSVLEKNGIRIPTVDKPWTGEEFNAVLETLKGKDGFKYPFSVGNPTGSGASYALSPYLWSFGGDLIDRSTHLSAKDKLNGPEAVKFGKWLQGLRADGLTNPDAADGSLFAQGAVPLQWDGNWAAQDSIDKYGDDVVFLPPPDFGNGIKVGAGSFGYGASSSCTPEQKKGVEAFLQDSLTTENIAKISTTQNVIPASAEAAAKTKDYAAGGRLENLAKLEAEHSEIRPATPAFTVIDNIFNKAVGDIFAGADVQKTLDQAVQEIDANIAANDGYGFKK
ncbi:carbohydrate ABC transporter substrate-binding protein (CUT1 family) [Arthrobacter sp. SLBN-100]|uniref:ABC transporter substrate-binding protein n=1 Tax=Arthrobacter sp. SLBN-100 TaxID=2768450 RepID=UPI001153E0E0|nr:extracellular solute-binding protein [Arthrobacter sp. SLBN-100]TQJ62057.1 carbohydrate ABC transporter substrate-binding protein (CUT1 family) [Arthrobacter sp. SLBN-100]